MTGKDDESQSKDMIYGIMKAKMPSIESAKKNAEKMKDCPKIILSGVTNCYYYGIFMLTNDTRWWLTYAVDHPEVLGADEIEVLFVDEPIEEVELRIHEDRVKNKIAPCGSDCSRCPMMSEYDCEGCPATIHHRDFE